jgi:hypothetical protein
MNTCSLNLLFMNIVQPQYNHTMATNRKPSTNVTLSREVKKMGRKLCLAHNRNLTNLLEHLVITEHRKMFGDKETAQQVVLEKEAEAV